MPPRCGVVLSRGLAGLPDLQRRLGLKDLFDLYEVALVNSYNERAARKIY